MRVVMFCQSIRSDWNHGNAHFLRGIATELQRRGHRVAVLEPRLGWSATQLAAEHGSDALRVYERAYPNLSSECYDLSTLDLGPVLDGADLVLVHEWNEPELVARIGAHRPRGGRRYRLFFHDTHHRAVTDPGTMAAYDLREYDAVLAFGAAVRNRYLDNGWAARAFVWHEAADTQVFRPVPRLPAPLLDLVWIGNWGDEERTRELEDYLLEPARRLGLRGEVYGVRYPSDACERLARAGLTYRGWLPNFLVPSVFARARATVHVLRRPYAAALPGIPTIRVFEALACGIPLICSRWEDREQLFTPGRDFLVAADGDEMRRHLDHLLAHPAEAAALARHGRVTVLSRHTCVHRVDELLALSRRLEAQPGRTG
ncbi:MAG: glycosyltransferase [Candidatus Binatia bacterium]